MRTRTKWNDSEAVCPFFMAHGAREIVCESPVPESKLKLIFADGKGKGMQYRAFCCGKYQNCEVYRSVMDTYADGD